ncbi:MAG: hypothetical protein ACI9OH_002807 [Oleispira sp.]|jgi:hypothetical protein
MIRVSNTFLSIFITFIIAISLIAVLDWDVLSLSFLFGFISCTILLSDVIKSARGGLNLFDPSLFIGGLCVFLLFVSPISQVYWDFWPFLPSMGNDLLWVDLWAGLNLAGVIVYWWSKNIPFSLSKSPHRYRMKIWSIAPQKFPIVVACFLFICFAAQVYVYISFGGISGFINSFTIRQEEGVANGDPFSGLGMLMLVAESFKFVFAVAVIYYVRISGRYRSNRAFILLMLLLLVIFIFFGGLRGSRSSTLFPLFFAAGMYHFWVREITGKIIVLGLIGVLLFSTSYYWYKVAGAQGVDAIFDSSLRTDFHSDRQDATQYLIARDLGRMDFQSLALKRVYDDEFPLSYGRTYLVSLFSSIPKALIPYKPDQITKEKTELIYGEGSYDSSSNRQTTLVLGQAGEMLINFGWFGVLVFYFLLGRWVSWVRFLFVNLHSDDLRRFFLPVLCFMPLLFLITDMNVIVYQLVRYLALPSLMFLFCAQISFEERKNIIKWKVSQE